MPTIYPSKNIFDNLKRNYRLVPIYLKIKLNIDSLSIYKRFRGINSFILHSTSLDKDIARYSFIGFEPFFIIKSKKGNILINKKPFKGNPFNFLRNKISFFSTIRYKELPLYFGGAVGYFAYDMVHFFEKIPETVIDDINTPDMYFLFINKSIIYDELKKELYIVVLGNDYKILEKELRHIYDKLNTQPQGIDRKIKAGKLFSNFKKADYLSAIRKVKQYIIAGDTFQVNLSQRFETTISCDPLAIYENLIKINPAPFSAFMDFEDVKIISSSPERLVRAENNLVMTMPIAGTRKRGKSRNEDIQLEKDLISNEKEIAEHIMLVDLERNDLGRVCDYGSVKVSEMMKIQRYSHVMHLVSTITGILRKNMDCSDLINAVFPGGTITGCPKIRTMEIIDELEPTARGIYCGSLGYFNFAGDMDFNIIIRTLIMKGDKIYLQSGGGIVYDSIPEQEYKETLYKASAMIKAISSRQFVNVYHYANELLADRMD